MSIQTLKEQLPDYAKDIKLNLSSLLNIDNLNKQQLYGTLYASALAAGNPSVTNAILEEAKSHLDETALNAVRAANSIMAMNNIYYRFAHEASDKDYLKMPANLRMNVIGNSGVDKVDFEMFALAVSAINGCGLCIDTHEKSLKKHDIDKSQIQNVIRIAAIVHAVSKTL